MVHIIRSVTERSGVSLLIPSQKPHVIFGETMKKLGKGKTEPKAKSEELLDLIGLELVEKHERKEKLKYLIEYIIFSNF